MLHDVILFCSNRVFCMYLLGKPASGKLLLDLCGASRPCFEGAGFLFRLSGPAGIMAVPDYGC